MAVLLEVNIGNEESKSGFLSDEVIAAVEEISKLPNIFIKGLMSLIFLILQLNPFKHRLHLNVRILNLSIQKMTQVLN